MKYFIITVDTEGDNLWQWKLGDVITTHNSRSIARFQDLCEKYNFKPVYLVNYEMAHDKKFVDYIKEKVMNNKCEVGMHLHAWNTPPEYMLEQRYDGCPYITEYPEEVVYEKHKVLKRVIEEAFGITPVSYRAGRWATNDSLFKVLTQLGFQCDCSVTPQIDFKNCSGYSVEKGNSYLNFPDKAYRINDILYEVPMTTGKIHAFIGDSLKSRVKNLLLGKELWLRPAVCTYEEMIYLKNNREKRGSEYLEFMIHSSELMAKGSPYASTESEIDALFIRMERFFESVKDEYEGISLRDYCEKVLNSIE